MEEHAGCAIGRERIVEGRAIVQPVDRAQVVEKHPSNVLDGGVEAVDVDTLLRSARCGWNPEDDALVGDHVVELVAAKEPGDGRMAAALPSAHLDGDCEIVAARETEAHHEMCDRLPHPMRGDEVG